jgi:hypothetical protein
MAVDPPGTVVLDGGAEWTASGTVQVAVVPLDGSTPTEVRLANTGTLVDGELADGASQPWGSTPDATSVAWSLDAAPCPCGDGERVVWAQWRTADGPWSPVVSDSITVDRAGPTGSVTIDGGAPTFGDPWDWRNSGYWFPSVTLTITVADAGPNIPPRAWAVSRDGKTWEQHPLDAYGTFDVAYELINAYNGDEGVKTVWAKFQDGLGNWSDPVTDTITLRFEWAGQVVVGDGSGYVDSLVVPVRFPLDVVPPEGVASVWVSSDYEGCDVQPYDAECAAREIPWSEDMVIQWDLRDSRYLGSTRLGHRRVIAWWVSTTGRVTQWHGAEFTVDREEPVSGPPRPMFVTNSVISDTSSRSRVTARVRWSAGGTGSPVAENRLQQSTNGGAWVSVALPAKTSTSATLPLSQADTHRFRARILDKAGNWGSWTTGAAFRVAAVQQDRPAIRYNGAWRTRARSDASGGTLALARARGSRASMTFTGRGVAVVAPRLPMGGEMNVYIDGRFVKTVYLYGSSYQARRVVFTKSWASTRSHTIAVVKKYANPDAAIWLDAFLVLR